MNVIQEEDMGLEEEVNHELQKLKRSEWCGGEEVHLGRRGS